MAEISPYVHVWAGRVIEEVEHLGERFYLVQYVDDQSQPDAQRKYPLNVMVRYVLPCAAVHVMGLQFAADGVAMAE